MHTAAPLGLLFALAITLFHVSSACSLTSPCFCDYTPSRIDTLYYCKLHLSGNLCGNETLLHTGLRVNCSNTSIICNDAFKTSPCKDCVHALYLDDNNISVIEPDAFRGLQQLEVAYIDNNKIGELHHSTFQHNPILKRLDVSVNRLGFLHPDTFKNMKLFYFLNVSFNMLVLNGTILNSKYLNILDAAYCNRKEDSNWSVLNNAIFSGLPNLTRLILEGNGIKSLSTDTFAHNPRLLELSLKNNALKIIPHEVFRYSHNIKLLHLSNNPLLCDCYMKLFSVWCYNHSVELDEVSCGTPRATWNLLETLSCDTVPLSFTFMPITDSSNAATSVSVRKPTTSPNTGSFTAPALASTSESNVAASRVSGSSTVNAMTSSVYIDQQETIPKNGNNISSLAQSTMQIPHNYTRGSNLTLPKVEPTTSSWYVRGAICSLMISVVLVIITIRVCRRANLGGSVPATHAFTFKLCSRSRRTNDEVNESCYQLPDISLDNLHKVSRQKTELHYSSRDVTSVTDVRSQVPLQRHREVATYRCSGILETNIDTLCTTMVHEEHVYEVIN